MSGLEPAQPLSFLAARRDVYKRQGLQAEQMLLDMRDQILGGQVTAEQGMKAAQDAINQLLAVQ